LALAGEAPTFSPHVTLLGQIPGEGELIQNVTESLLDGVTPFELVLSRVGMLNTYYRSIILHVEENQKLLDLYIATAETFKMKKGKTFVPHLSLLYSNFVKLHKQDLLKSVDLYLPDVINISEVVLMETRGGPQDWQEVARFSLK